MYLNGADVTEASARKRMSRRRNQVGYLFQDYALIDNETVAENIALAAPGLRELHHHLGGEAHRRDKAVPFRWLRGRGERTRLVSDALVQVGLAGRERDKVFQLNGGEQQRVAVAGLLVRRPALVLADEPTASLDRRNAALILEKLAELAAGGAAVVVVSHDPWVVDHCDRTRRSYERKTTTDGPRGGRLRHGDRRRSRVRTAVRE
ncbi:ATP-binding cassette domain-containing protein [Corynebacterium frankenforstense]